MTNSPSGADPAVDRLLQRARAELDRVLAVDLPAQIAAGALVVDIRPVGQRLRDGDLPGAVVVDRNVLEWRLDPTSPHRLPIADDAADRPVIVVCNEGYSSSLAAASLRHLGLGGATDLVGGFQEWLATPRGSSSPSCRRVVLNGGSPQGHQGQRTSEPPATTYDQSSLCVATAFGAGSPWRSAAERWPWANDSEPSQA